MLQLHQISQDFTVKTPFNVKILTNGKHCYLFVIQIMNFVKYDPLQISNDIRSIVKHGPQNLSCHDKAGCGRIDLNITGNQTDTFKIILEVTKLLV